MAEILEPGAVLFGYRILEFVGEGGWAYVYKAQHPNLPMVVAIKQLKPKWVENENALQRFLREAHIVSQLSHPNIVKIFDLKQDPQTGEHYIITEFAEKGTLADRLRKSPEGLSIDEVLQLATSICNGLEAVHRKGIVHRDIKPHNILLYEGAGNHDIPKLSDFGIAKDIVGASEVAPPSSSAHGSIHYMSPEQLDAREVDHRCDLYALGILVYELLTGKVPFTGGVQDIYNMHMFVSPTSPKELRTDIPEALERIVLQALRKDQEKRYQSAADMREAIEAILDSEVRKQRQSKFKILFERCLTALQEEEWETAIQLLRQADLLEPGNEQVQAGIQKAEEQQRLKRLYELAFEQLAAEDWESAREHLVDIINLDPDYAGGQARNQLEQVQQELERKRIWADLMIHYRIGMGHFRKWQWVQAIAELEQVVAQDPKFKDVADLLQKAQQYLRADQSFRQAKSCQEQGEWEKVVDLLEEVARMRPPHIDVTRALENARAEWASVRMNQQLATWYKEGTTQLEGGRLKQSRASFLKIFERQPDYRDVAHQLKEIEKKSEMERLFSQASGHEAANEWGQAVNAYREILDIDPYNQKVSRRLRRAQKRAERESPRLGNIITTMQDWWNGRHRHAKAALVGLFGVIVLASIAGGTLVLRMAFPSQPMATPAELTAMLTTTSIISPTSTTLTLTPIPARFSYPAPVLVVPGQGKSFARGRNVKLQWKWERDLAEDEFFEVRIRLKGEQEFEQIGMIKGPYQFVPSAKLTQTGTYEWQVAIVSIIGEERIASEVWSFEVR